MSTDLRDFIRARVRRDLEASSGTAVATRFPPEPNGYLHIGHAKSICLNFGIAEEFGGKTYLRFDDTNPLAESEEFVNSMAEDVRWLGFNFVGPTFASDYFDQLYAFANSSSNAAKRSSAICPPTKYAPPAARSPAPARRARTATATWRKTWICFGA